MPSALEAARVSASSLPVIDISGLSSGSAADRQAVGAHLRGACLDKGFFYVKNHGVSEQLVDDVFAEAAAFFALPAEQKAQVDKANSKANRGYEPLQGQTLEPGAPPDLKEGYYIGPEHGPDHPRVVAGIFNHGANQWPVQRPNFRPVMMSYLDVSVTRCRSSIPATTPTRSRASRPAWQRARRRNIRRSRSRIICARCTSGPTRANIGIR
jgi:isopenicillin N synthase-like dioxygenase